MTDPCSRTRSDLERRMPFPGFVVTGVDANSVRLNLGEPRSATSNGERYDAKYGRPTKMTWGLSEGHLRW